MKINYDKKIDALYIHLKKGKFYANEEIEEGVVLDLGAKGELLGVEILDASKYMSRGKLMPSLFLDTKATSQKASKRLNGKRSPAVLSRLSVA